MKAAAEGARSTDVTGGGRFRDALGVVTGIDRAPRFASRQTGSRIRISDRRRVRGRIESRKV
jgi:hypothetical protein